MNNIGSQIWKTFSLVLRGVGVLLVVAVGTAVFTNYELLYSHLRPNPGQLSGVNHSGKTLGGFDSHAMFEENCSHCHAPVHCITDTKCQDCHLEIARQRIEAVGLHSLFPGTEKCQSCHIEHQGRDAVISEVKLNNINHQELSGFTLAHHETRFDGTRMNCEDCHTEGRFASDEVNCVTCHEDANGELIAQHSAEHGENCLDCHDGSGAIVNFDHNTVYILEAGHKTVGCVECHSDYLLTDTTQTCKACHGEPDIHAGQFGQTCSRCHTAVAWAPAQLTQHRFKLDHGDEETLECVSCHTTSYTEVTCVDCHEQTDMQTAHPPESVTDNVLDAPCISCHLTGEAGDAIPLAKAGTLLVTDQ